MATYKRRIVYFSDEMWATVRRQAEAHNLTASDWLRALVATEAFERQETAKGRDPYAEFRPVPKPGRK